MQTAKTQSGYDLVAEDYALKFRDELEHKPFDRMMLDRLMEMVTDQGTICDLGCGGGQIARYIHEHGRQTCGVDLSAEMIKQAQRLNPGIPFRQGNMLELMEIADNSFAGIAAFYSVIHIPRQSVVAALSELTRVLCPNGKLLVTFHLGQTDVHLDEWWGKKVSLDFFFYEAQEMKDWLKQAGFELVETLERDPYPDIEVQTRRAYIFANNPKPM